MLNVLSEWSNKWRISINELKLYILDLKRKLLDLDLILHSNVEIKL